MHEPAKRAQSQDNNSTTLSRNKTKMNKKKLRKTYTTMISREARRRDIHEILFSFIFCEWIEFIVFIICFVVSRLLVTPE